MGLLNGIVGCQRTKMANLLRNRIQLVLHATEISRPSADAISAFSNLRRLYIGQKRLCRNDHLVGVVRPGLRRPFVLRQTKRERRDNGEHGENGNGEKRQNAR